MLFEIIDNRAFSGNGFSENTDKPDYKDKLIIKLVRLNDLIKQISCSSNSSNISGPN
jgi:hypothetical protein